MLFSACTFSTEYLENLTRQANARVVASQPVKKVQQLQLLTAPSFEEARQNPHFDRRLGAESLQPRSKKSRKLHFAPKGKFVKLADGIRQEQRMEELKARIAESARRAGLDEEMDGDGGLARRVKRPPPPAVEWWDATFLKGETYEALEDEDIWETKRIWEEGCSNLVQHPIPIPAPQDKKQVAPKALMLTKKERKKMRRQRRNAAMKDHQDRVKMGLLPPDPPKIKLSNMMRVLTQEAVADPTKVESRVRREMNLRKMGHEKMNQERHLTDEQRRAKVEEKAQKEEAKGIYAAAFKCVLTRFCTPHRFADSIGTHRVRYLSNPAHKFKVKKNAEQLYLTGTCIFHPKFCLVVVEGSSAAVKKYKKLMLSRIDWTAEPTALRTGDDDEQNEADTPLVDPVDEADAAASTEVPVSLADNTCQLVWEGQHRERMFPKGFRPKSCPTDHIAREYLGDRAMGLFDTARKMGDANVLGD